MRTTIAATLASWLLLCSTTPADIRLPRLFANKLVLQQQTSDAADFAKAKELGYESDDH